MALLDERFKQGPHKLAKEHGEFLHAKLLILCQKGFWVLLPYDKVGNLPGWGGYDSPPSWVWDHNEDKCRGFSWIACLTLLTATWG